VTGAVGASFGGASAALIVAAAGFARSGRPGLPVQRSAPPRIGLMDRIDPRLALGTLAVAACLLSPVPALTPIVGLVAWRVPSFAAARRAKARHARTDAELPQLLDLLAAASSAGLSASLALRRALGALEGPLADELGEVIRAVDLGGRWRDELRAAADRLDLPDLRRTVVALTRTETLGSSLSTSMNELAERVRASRRAAVTERARTAPVKMLFPLVFLVLPAFLLLTVVPVLLTTVQSIR
jgi:tight adherence protein C